MKPPKKQLNSATQYKYFMEYLYLYAVMLCYREQKEKQKAFQCQKGQNKMENAKLYKMFAAAQSEKDVLSLLAQEGVDLEGCSDGLYLNNAATVYFTNDDIRDFLHLSERATAEEIADAYWEQDEKVDAHFIYEQKGSVLKQLADAIEEQED